jgi:hypothetical protein
MTATSSTLILGVLAFTTLVLLASRAVPVSHGTGTVHPSRQPELVHGHSKSYYSALRVSNLSRKITILEATGQLSPLSASKAWRQLDSVVRTRQSLLDSHKTLRPADDHRMAILIADLDRQVNELHRHDIANRKSSWF